MIMIEIAPLANGAHRNQTSSCSEIPNNWAIVPDDMEIPSTFPFVEITAENGVVTSMTAGIVPPVVEPDREPTEMEDLSEMLIDHEMRLTLLELGVE